VTALSASKIELALRCPGAFALPTDPTRSREARDGDAAHAEDEAAINEGDIPALLEARWPGYTWRAEVAYAYDVRTRTGRELGQAIGRRYDLRPGEVPGTADAVGRGPNGELVIVDKKSYADVSPAADNAQVHFLAMAAMSAYGVRHAEVAINHKLRGLDVAAVDEITASLCHKLLVSAMAKVAAARASAEYHPGPHCRWCDAFHACPAQQELTALVVSGAAETRIEHSIPFRNDDAANDAYELRGRLRILLKRLDSALYARATERPIPLRNGKLFGPHTKTGNEKLDGDITYAVVKSLHGQGVADMAVERKASKTRLRDALGMVGGKGQVASLERKVLDEVRARGGSARETKTEVIEYEPQLELAEGSR
jgi:hypothetical protein